MLEAISRSTVVRACATLQIVLLSGVVAAFLTAPSTRAARVAAAVAAALPLISTLPGLLRDSRRAVQLLAILLVLYIGWAVVEVTANTHSAWAKLCLASACAELALLLTLARRPTG